MLSVYLGCVQASAADVPSRPVPSDRTHRRRNAQADGRPDPALIGLGVDGVKRCGASDLAAHALERGGEAPRKGCTKRRCAQGSGKADRHKRQTTMPLRLASCRSPSLSCHQPCISYGFAPSPTG
ncbi:hypothetical protein RJ55_04560 [Drechmeria coniospora]|nr:hypothetical protein RJ55_04560 [Drechmeria coniospora]